ncbi:hypothetical protein Syn7502_01716 [Synechococcus sp. PCC 7502]|uniref:DUF4259 domain-containing protein n=1 Tax=Synechococcus sp. PCC 7502 TaxID=1173263 RepID=UPI00029FA214|nr:DUF4259 domain-containing protein [Synechococcus sp. PCC 7502]AFY73768.1 hypothetical protein Syn7502_01716 [Synechococcus sp. PCC 7502]
MGTWSTDPFGNDTAVDWIYALVEANDLSFIAETLQNVIDIGSDYLEVPEADEAIAAADTIARLKGNFYVKNSYTESLDQWVQNHKLTPPQALVDLAILAMNRILTEPSELLELWQDSEDFDDWAREIQDLKDRLR